MKSIIDSETSRRVAYARAGATRFRGRVHKPCECRRRSCEGFTLAVTARVYGYDDAMAAARRLALFLGAPQSAAAPYPEQDGGAS